MGIRSLSYQLARLMGDVNAVQKGKIGRRAAGKVAGRSMGKLFK